MARFATAAGLRAARATDLVTAVNEVATNSIVHGGGGESLRMWRMGGTVVCEVRDAGAFDRPLVDRVRPGLRSRDPRGLWLANELCDLVQSRSMAGGTAVRVHMHVHPVRSLTVVEAS